MKFALLGEHSDARCVTLAIAQHREHSLSVAVAGVHAAELLAIAPGIRLVESWEDLLATDASDCVLVAGGDESVIAGAKQLAADGRSLRGHAAPHQDSCDRLTGRLARRGM